MKRSWCLNLIILIIIYHLKVISCKKTKNVLKVHLLFAILWLGMEVLKDEILWECNALHYFGWMSATYSIWCCFIAFFFQDFYNFLLFFPHFLFRSRKRIRCNWFWWIPTIPVKFMLFMLCICMNLCKTSSQHIF